MKKREECTSLALGRQEKYWVSVSVSEGVVLVSVLVSDDEVSVSDDEAETPSLPIVEIALFKIISPLYNNQILALLTTSTFTDRRT